MKMSRREILTRAGAGMLTAGCAAAETGLQATPPETEGPFFPVNTAVERDADLTRLAGRSARATGQVIEVRGRLLDSTGAPILGAEVELWQANAAGRYTHPRDTSSAPLDPNFQGYALLRTGADGGFSIISIKPGAYRTGGQLRTPHLHWKFANGARRLTTQMYFPGEALNENDMLIRRMGDARPLIAEAGAVAEAGALGFDWVVVLPA
ncbi:MAG: dioxygenase family protein [Caulobacteraceae bacterium]